MLRASDGRPTTTYRRYLKYEAAFLKAQRDYDEALAEAHRDPELLQSWPITGVAHRRKAQAAYDMWVVKGHKAEVESALALLDTSCDTP